MTKARVTNEEGRAREGRDSQKATQQVSSQASQEPWASSHPVFCTPLHASPLFAYLVSPLFPQRLQGHAEGVGNVALL